MSLSKRTSFEKIHYLLRPGKNIQRKLICDSLSCISKRIDFSDYTYIGFGSVYFVDFSLFHKTFGFKKMISIEGDDEAEKRVHFNVPFSCIDVKMGYSGKVLPTLSLTGQKTIVWLDYDYGLNASVLRDIKMVCQAVGAGSILLVTLDYSLKELEREPEPETRSQEETYDEQHEEHQWSDLSTIDKFKTKLGFAPLISLQGAIAENYRLAVEDTIKLSVGGNDLLSTGATQQFLNFHYDDGREMMTVGFFLGNEPDVDVKNLDLEKLPYYSSNSSVFEIDPPKLTFKEIRSLNEYMPCEEGKLAEIAQAVPLSEEYIGAYRRFYKYFPTFTEVEM